MTLRYLARITCAAQAAERTARMAGATYRGDVFQLRAAATMRALCFAGGDATNDSGGGDEIRGIGDDDASGPHAA